MTIILKGQSRFLNVPLKFAVITFSLAVLLNITSLGYIFFNKKESNTAVCQVKTIANKIKNMDYIDEKTKSEITQLLDEFNKQNNNGLYYIDITKGRQSYVHYKYKKDAPENFFSRAYKGENGWLISYNISEAQANNDYYKQKDAQGRVTNSLPVKLFQISVYLFILSLTLLSAYLILKAYGRKIFNNK